MIPWKGEILLLMIPWKGENVLWGGGGGGGGIDVDGTTIRSMEMAIFAQLVCF